MTQSSFSLPNSDGATFRGNNNTGLQALATLSSGATAPTTTYAGQLWWDTANNLIKQRNGANTAWIDAWSFDGTTLIPYRSGTATGTAAVQNTGTSGAVVPLLNGRNQYSAGQLGVPVTLTDAATIAVNMALGNNFTVTLAGNRTLGNPTNIVAGQGGVIIIKQDATGTRTLAYASNWKFEGSATPVLSTAPNAIDMLGYYCEAATRIHAQLTRAWTP